MKSIELYNSLMIDTLSPDLVNDINNLTETLPYYANFSLENKIGYISDLHLMHHCAQEFGNDMDLAIKTIVKDLVKSIKGKHVSTTIFAGDISSNREYTLEFYKRFSAEWRLTSRQDRFAFVVLGNHEYIDFDSISEAVEWYRPRLDELGITLLHNEYDNLTDENAFDIVIYGGTGFAKYNHEYNADNILCCKGFNREAEIKETEAFQTGYYCALEHAKLHNMPFICISHYPINDCLENSDKEAIYFYGHNHQNYFTNNSEQIIYADNQVGYKPVIKYRFKTVESPTIRNPFCNLEDGAHIISPDDYLLYYNRYVGEYIGEGKLIYKRSEGNKLYVVKKHGYYGFFIVNKQVSQSRGISIVTGGQTKKIASTTNIQWVVDNFDTVLIKYLQLATPIRKVLVELSDEVKALGLSGKIHGTIVDIDFYRHIMLNPFDGTITYYHSSSFGMVHPFARFEDLVLYMKKTDALTTKQCDRIIKKLEKHKNASNYLLNTINETMLIETSNSSVSITDFQEQSVSRTDGAYGVSRRLNPLHRLFTIKTLCAFNADLIDDTLSIDKN